MIIHALESKITGSEILFDAFSPFLVKANNLRLKFSQKKINAKYCWGIRNIKEMEKWGTGIRLLSEWHPFDRLIPRMNHIKWMRHIPFLAKITGVYHFQLGIPVT